MPIYDYLCPKCGRLYELIRPIEKRDDAGTCKGCGAKLSRVQSKPTVVVK